MIAPIERSQAKQDSLYAETAAFAPAIARLARAAERDGDRARDLEQEIHLALWRRLASFDGRCSLSTWTYRVAHNVAATHAARGARTPRGITLEQAAEDTASLIAPDNPEQAAGQAQLLASVNALIARLQQPDRSIILLYLEGVEAATIAEIVGISAANVAVKVHRIKAMLRRHFQMGEAA